MSELDELRLKIAEQYGWVNIREDLLGNGLYGFLPNEKPSFIPDWPRDIAAAWELVEDMCLSGDGLPGLIFKSGAIPKEPGKTAWVFELRLLVQGVYKFNRDEILGVGATPAEAICRAFLAWRENKNG
jgi:hypothetical protein